MQNSQQLADRIAKLNPAQQNVVEKLIEKLEFAAIKPEMTLDAAINEFEREHRELLRLLAQ